MSLQTYEFHVYTATPDGDVSADATVQRIPCFSEKAAISTARQMAKPDGIGPVDLARAGPSPWADRYVGTASRKWPGTKSLATEFEAA